MATLILGTVGRIVAGPLGGLFGTFLGSSLDRAILGAPKRREVGRLGNLAVQSSAYGEPIPKIFGIMRVAGNLVWTAGIAEHSSTSGGGKRGGAKTTSYSYSASFAVLLSARAVGSVGRVWADGKLLRDAGGSWLSPVTMRLHMGGEGQGPDPLIIAAEGAGGAPAYRGLAYAVFEDLPLADYGNRIPNLTFELVSDVATDAGAIVGALAPEGVTPRGVFPVFRGFAAAQAGSVRDQLGALSDLHDLRYVDDGETLTVRAGPVAGPMLAAGDLGTRDDKADPHGARPETRGAAGQLDDAVAIGFHDPARDWQPGLQRAVRRAQATRVAQFDVAAAFDADTAKGLAADLLARRSAARTGATFNLPPRTLAARAGMAVSREGDTSAWSVRRWTFSNFVSELAVERRPARLAAVAAADPGRVHDAGDSAPGPTRLEVLDLPSLPGETSTSARLLIAAAGAAPGWRRSSFQLSADGGETYAYAGEAGAASVMGLTTTAIAAGCDDRWDRVNRVEVELLADSMWLEGRSEAAVLAGANLAVVGDEVLQFAEVAPLSARRFVLSGLLRGRGGSAGTAHPAGTRFVLLDPDRLVAVEPGIEAVGRTLRFRATGNGDAASPAVLHGFTGAALRPFAPAFLRMVADGGDLAFSWVRRGSGGLAWTDGVDAPLDAPEAYAVEVSSGGNILRTASVSVSSWRYPTVQRAADGPAASLTVAVAQLGVLAGPPLTVTFDLS